MRPKLIGVYSAIVALLALLSFAVAKGQLSSVTRSPETRLRAARAEAQGAAARIELDAVQLERWASVKAADPRLAEALGRGTSDAQGQAARAVCESILTQPAGTASQVSLCIVTDATGHIIGRNGTDSARGDDLGSAFAVLTKVVAGGSVASDIWSRKERGEQHLVAVAPVRDASGKSVAALTLGIPLTDEISGLGEAGGTAVALADKAGQIVAFGNGAEALKQKLRERGASEVSAALSGAGASTHDIDETAVSAQAFRLLDGGKGFSVLSAAQGPDLSSVEGLPLSLLGIGLLGLLMVFAVSNAFAQYIEKPVRELEDGLLAVMNGQTDKRFNLTHTELGGLGYRIDQLLNAMMGIQEDTSDADGRVVYSSPPGAMIGDLAALDSNDVASALAAMPEEAYYQSLFQDYLRKKQSKGDATEHITFEVFRDRIRNMEADAKTRTGARVRYRAGMNGTEVVLVAVPLP